MAAACGERRVEQCCARLHIVGGGGQLVEVLAQQACKRCGDGRRRRHTARPAVPDSVTVTQCAHRTI